jgi:hypothetical protein
MVKPSRSDTVVFALRDSTIGICAPLKNASRFDWLTSGSTVS